MLVFSLWVGNFELYLTSHLFYKCITVVSTVLLYHMYGKLFILFFSPPGFNIEKSTITECYWLSYILLWRILFAGFIARMGEERVPRKVMFRSFLGVRYSHGGKRRTGWCT